MTSYDETHDAIVDTMGEWWDTEDDVMSSMGWRSGRWYRWSAVSPLEEITAEQAIEWLVVCRGVDREEAEDCVAEWPEEGE